MFAKSVVVALAAAGVVNAQVPVGNYSSSLDMKIDPNTVDAQTRAQWCGAEYTSCSQLCGKTDTTNDCSSETLEYKCICGSNSSAPALQYYAQTMPTFICQQLFDTCNSENVGFRRNQEACETNIRAQCGKQDPSKASTGGSDDASTTSGSSTTASSPDATTGTDSSPSPTSSPNKNMAASGFAAGQGIVAAAAAVGVFAFLI